MGARHFAVELRLVVGLGGLMNSYSTCSSSSPSHLLPRHHHRSYGSDLPALQKDMTVDEDEDSADDEDTVLLKQKIKAVCQVAFGQFWSVRRALAKGCCSHGFALLAARLR